MCKPYNEKIEDGIKYRTFTRDVENSELVWHRDRQDRIVQVLEGNGWHFQMDNALPLELHPGDILNIPKETYHRIFKVGSDDLKISIRE